MTPEELKRLRERASEHMTEARQSPITYMERALQYPLVTIALLDEIDRLRAALSQATNHRP